MTLTLSAWMIPTAACLTLVAWAFLMPLPKAHGDYNFAPAISMMFRLVVLVVGCLIAWLAYFAVT